METAAKLAKYWRSPEDVFNVLMIIGGDVVRTALAQSTGNVFTPVCFSFGWVAYIFGALLSVLGDGRLLPPADYRVKVFNLDSGYAMENKNWVIGRIVRDHETHMNREYPLAGALRISILDACPVNRRKYSWFGLNVQTIGLLCMLSQLVVASIPIVTHKEWTIILIAAVGTILSLSFGSLPQWRTEKLPIGQRSRKVFALTSGNGSNDIMIIRGNGHCLDLEELAIHDTPRNERPWRKYIGSFSRPDPSGRVSNRTGRIDGQTRMLMGYPLGYCLTVVTAVVHFFLWIAVLVTISSVDQGTWYLLLVGTIGMIQNGVVGAMERRPESRNMPLKLYKVIHRNKKMLALMDLEVCMGSAKPLVGEFFPGKLRDDEVAWWDGKRGRDRKMDDGHSGVPMCKAEIDGSRGEVLPV